MGNYDMTNNNYMTGVGINYEGSLHKIKKSDVLLQPIFEAFTNSLDSIKDLKNKYNTTHKGSITINLYFNKDIFEQKEFEKIEIIDTGIGFDDIGFNRLVDLNDESKGRFNKGTGRVQFLHAFDITKISSIYRDIKSSTGFKQRKLTLSKSTTFEKHNAFIRKEAGNESEVDTKESNTTIIFETVLDKKDKPYFDSLSSEEMKKDIILKYMIIFCENRDNLPQIKINTLIVGEHTEELEIISGDIPSIDQQKPIDINYSKLNQTKIEKTVKKETFLLKAFKIDKNKLDKNALKLTSKGEIAKDIELNSLLPEEQIDGNRYLFLLSGEYINSKDSDTRGDIQIPKLSDFKKGESSSLFDEEEILLDDIKNETNDVIVEIYNEIKEKIKEKEENLKELEEMFLLNPETINSLKGKIKINDSDIQVLTKIYEADAKTKAEGDAKIKHQVEKLNELNTADNSNYNEELLKQVNDFVRTIPLQNRTALTQYVARRKLILDMFGKILDKQLDIQASTNRKIDEKLLHNLIFQQSSNNPEDSDLWLINEDFIYFKGVSEAKLKDIKIDGELVFNQAFEKEEADYLLSFGENRKIKTPDILLFPEESKCIIIELKCPSVPVRVHLGQIDFYAGLIRNFTNDSFNIDTFYGYLIGDKFDPRDIRLTDPRFVQSYHLDYMFRPSSPIAGDVFPNINRSDGSIYTEIIKYSTLLKRAKMRNKIFINKIKPI